MLNNVCIMAIESRVWVALRLFSRYQVCGAPAEMSLFGIGTLIHALIPESHIYHHR